MRLDPLGFVVRPADHYLPSRHIGYKKDRHPVLTELIDTSNRMKNTWRADIEARLFFCFPNDASVARLSMIEYAAGQIPSQRIRGCFFTAEQNQHLAVSAQDYCLRFDKKELFFSSAIQSMLQLTHMSP